MLGGNGGAEVTLSSFWWYMVSASVMGCSVYHAGIALLGLLVRRFLK